MLRYFRIPSRTLIEFAVAVFMASMILFMFLGVLGLFGEKTNIWLPLVVPLVATALFIFFYNIGRSYDESPEEGFLILSEEETPQTIIGFFLLGIVISILFVFCLIGELLSPVLRLRTQRKKETV